VALGEEVPRPRPKPSVGADAGPCPERKTPAATIKQTTPVPVLDHVAWPNAGLSSGCPRHPASLAYNVVMQRLTAVSADDLRETAGRAAVASRQGEQVVIEDAAGRTLAIVGANTDDIFGSDEDPLTESDDDAGEVRLIASSGAIDFGKSWRS
jgi:hypothetical protein